MCGTDAVWEHAVCGHAECRGPLRARCAGLCFVPLCCVCELNSCCLIEPHTAGICPLALQPPVTAKTLTEEQKLTAAAFPGQQGCWAGVKL